MAARIAAFDWASTPLGSTDRWSPALRTSLDIALASRFPMILWWGPELTVLYNDAYAPILAAKHPGALGAPGLSPAAWGDPDLRPVIEPMLRGVLERAEATWSENQLLILERHGFPEETYFTWSYSPVSEEGKVVGVFSAVAETTASVIGSRRLALLADLTAATLEVPTAEAVCQEASAVLDRYRADVPFHMIYLLSGEGRPALVAAAGAPEPLRGVDPGVFEGRLRHARPVIHLPELSPALPASLWPEPVRRATVVPLRGAGDHRRIGFAVVGLSPRLPHDDRYLDFVDLLAGRVAAAVSDARALEDEKRRTEALTELDRAKSIFLSNVSHEFRTPLTLMLGPLEDALAEGAGANWETQSQRLATARANGLRLLRLVNNLLDFSRLEAGRSPVAATPTDIAGFTAALVGVFESAFAAAGIELVVNIDRHPAPLDLDRDMWETVVFNLLSNALKYTPDGRVEVSLRVGSGEVVLSVSDTGVGVAPEDAPRVFERFYRGSGQAGRSLEGTGIGLALVKELLALHRGTIELSSVQGEGSTFTVRIPAQPSSEPVPEPLDHDLRSMRAQSFLEETAGWLPAPAGGPPPTETPSPPANPAARPAVLVVDDNAGMRRYLLGVLSSGFDVSTAANGAEALEAIRNRRPAAVITDVMMPVLDGFGLVREVRSDPQLYDLPVMMLSARAGPEATGEGLEKGADEYLAKPFSARELIARLGALIGSAQRRAQASEAEARRRQFSEAIGSMAGALNAETTMQGIATNVQRHLRPLAVTAAVLTVLEPEGAWLRQYFGFEPIPPRVRARYERLEREADAPNAAAIRAGQPLLFSDRQQVLASFPALAADPDAGQSEAVACLPLVAADQRCFGCLTLTWSDRQNFDSELIFALSDAAEIVARTAERVTAFQTQRRIAQTLQTGLLSAGYAGTAAAIRTAYRTSQAYLDVGGDWYDVVDLGERGVALAVGDVVGRGLDAAATMGQLKAALGSAALTAGGPAEALDTLDLYSRQLPGAECATAAVAFVDVAGERLAYARAGHPPPVAVSPTGRITLLEGGGSWPLSVAPELARPPADAIPFPAGSLLLLYTDGLVERRGESLDTGLARLEECLSRYWPLPLAILERRLAEEMLGGGPTDDVAIAALRTPVNTDRVLAHPFPADPAAVRGARRLLAAWLAEQSVPGDVADDLLLAAAEAMANAVEHGSNTDASNPVGLEASYHDGTITIAITDTGSWKSGLEGAQSGRGHGYTLMEALTDHIRSDTDHNGTVVILTRSVTPGA